MISKKMSDTANLKVTRAMGDNVELSKTLSWFLRHGAVKEKLSIDSEGYVPVDELLAKPKLRKYCLADVEQVVASCPKKRFGLLRTADRGVLIRANQGHSIASVKHMDMEKISLESAASYPTVVHGTYLNKWPLIASSGLSKMSRNHIHFASGLPGADGVISGMRKSCDLFIYVDLMKAIQDNNVILCPGNAGGLLPAKYFRSVKMADGSEISRSEPSDIASSSASRG